jgi:nucleolar protein 9
MPKENKYARGRREQEKMKRKRLKEDDDGRHNKRQKPLGLDNGIQFTGTDNAEGDLETGVYEPAAIERPFFGLLTDEEQEYFRHADELLELNEFPSSEERSLFLANVFKEAGGKELKIANSQSCSRLMERLILLSTPAQKKTLFQKFSGHFLHLVQHRFASHCCETLFIQSAPVVTEEIVSQSEDDSKQVAKTVEGVYVSMENLFLYSLNELEGHMGFLLTDRFASHALRVLLVVLSGQPLAKSSTRSLLQSKRKENIGIDGVESSTADLSLGKRIVPESFQFAVHKIISDIVVGLDTTSIHVLARHPTGNPSLQLLLELELTGQGKGKYPPSERSIIGTLLPDDISVPDSRSATFINGLVYEQIGSRLLETIVTYAPGKLFKQIYRSNIKERIGSLARNEIASFVVIKVLERLSKEDLEEVVGSIIPQIPGLIERSRTAIIKALLERCKVRNAEESIKLLTKAMEDAYGSEPETLLLKMVKMTPDLMTRDLKSGDKTPPSNPMAVHGSLLAQTMLSMPGKPAELVQASILAQSPSALLALACTTTASHVLQTSLSPTNTNLPFRRKAINLFLSPTSTDPSGDASIRLLALSKAGSHVLDALWSSTSHPSLLYIKERICAALHVHQNVLKDDFVGRVVLRNWMVELFGRHRAAWVTKAKESGSIEKPAKPGSRNSSRVTGIGKDLNAPSARSVRVGAGGTKGGDSDLEGKTKTAIELARERFAARKARTKPKQSGRAPKSISQTKSL